LRLTRLIASTKNRREEKKEGIYLKYTKASVKKDTKVFETGDSAVV